MRQNLVWIVVLLGVVAIGASLLAPARVTCVLPRDRSLVELVLARDSSLKESYRIRVMADGRWTSSLAVPEHPPRSANGSLGPTQLESFMTGLDKAGLWTVAEATSPRDGEEPGRPGMLWTELISCRGDAVHKSRWLGLPSPTHQALAQAFLEGPLGEEVGLGLKAVQGQP